MNVWHFRIHFFIESHRFNSNETDVMMTPLLLLYIMKFSNKNTWFPEMVAFFSWQVAHGHDPIAKIDYPESNAFLWMHNNEIHAELQICLLQKCQWTTVEQQLLACHDNYIKQDKASVLGAHFHSKLFHAVWLGILQSTTQNLGQNVWLEMITVHWAGGHRRRSEEMEARAGGAEGKMDICRVTEMHRDRQRRVERQVMHQ